MNKNLLQILKKGLPFIGIAILVYLIIRLDINKLIDALFSINPLFIVISLFLTIPLLIIRSYAWMLIQEEQKIHIKFFHSMKILIIGFFYGILTPGYVGQLMRIPYMKDYVKQPYGKLFVNVILEIVIHNLSLYTMMIVGAFLVLGSMPNLLIFTSVWMVIVILLILFFIKKERGQGLFYFLINVVIPKKYRPQFTAFVDTFYSDFPRIKRLIIPGILGSCTWIIIFTQEYLVVLALGLDIPYLYFLLLFPIANTAGFIPITFGGLGTREFTAIIIFSTLFGISGEKIFVFTIIGFLITDIFVGFIGFLLSVSQPKTSRIES
jgi:glycosyltransferase 2 family protein